MAIEFVTEDWSVGFLTLPYHFTMLLPKVPESWNLSVFVSRVIQSQFKSILAKELNVLSEIQIH